MENNNNKNGVNNRNKRRPHHRGNRNNKNHNQNPQVAELQQKAEEAVESRMEKDQSGDFSILSADDFIYFADVKDKKDTEEKYTFTEEELNAIAEKLLNI